MSIKQSESLNKKKKKKRKDFEKKTKFNTIK